MAKPNWITTSPNSGTGGGNINVTCSPTLAIRVGNVTIGNSSISKTCQVTQDIYNVMLMFGRQTVMMEPTELAFYTNTDQADSLTSVVLTNGNITNYYEDALNFEYIQSMTNNTGIVGGVVMNNTTQQSITLSLDFDRTLDLSFISEEAILNKLSGLVINSVRAGVIDVTNTYKALVQGLNHVLSNNVSMTFYLKLQIVETNNVSFQTELLNLVTSRNFALTFN